MATLVYKNTTEMIRDNHRFTITATESIPRYAMVDADGANCTDAKEAFGVAMQKNDPAEIGELIMAVRGDDCVAPVLVEAGTYSKGTRLTAGAGPGFLVPLVGAGYFSAIVWEEDPIVVAGGEYAILRAIITQGYNAA